jgi:hypothetical protein
LTATAVGVARWIQGDIERFSRAVRRPLRHYQLQAARAILQSIRMGQGRTFTVMMARQMGKNELSAQLEAFLLYMHQRRGGQMVKAAPTYKPQLITSKTRLERVLSRLPGRLPWRSRYGYMVELGAATVHFLSADEASNVMGATANMLLEIDEAQDVSEEKYLRDFRPMGATSNVTTVLYGTAWSEDSLLAQQRTWNLGQDPEAHFSFAWEVLAELSPAYRAFVSSEIRRLGLEHPVVKSQYLLETIERGGRLLSGSTLSLMAGSHQRLCVAEEDGVYVAGVDVAGESEVGPDAVARVSKPRRDSTVVTIARVSRPAELLGEPVVEVVEHHWWTGRDHSTQYSALLELLRERWRCSQMCVDGTGVGAGVASWLARSLGARVVVVQFTRPLKSEIGYELLAAANGGRVRMYADDGSAEWGEFWEEVRLCRYSVAAGASLGWYVDAREGHDDFVTSLGLCVRAASMVWASPPESAVIPPRWRGYEDGRF